MKKVKKNPKRSGQLQHPGLPIFVEHWGDNLQFHPNFALFSTLGEVNLDHDFVQVSKLSEDQKKRSSPKMEHFFPQIQVKTQKKGLHRKWNTFSPNSGEDQKKKILTKDGTLFSPVFKWTPTLRCTPESNYWGECRCRPYSNYWGGYIPRVSAPLATPYCTVQKLLKDIAEINNQTLKKKNTTAQLHQKLFEKSRRMQHHIAFVFARLLSVWS